MIQTKNMFSHQVILALSICGYGGKGNTGLVTDSS